MAEQPSLTNTFFSFGRFLTAAAALTGSGFVLASCAQGDKVPPPCPEVRDDKLFSIGSSYGLRKGDDHIKKLLNDGLAKIIADGTLEKIKTQYFGPLDISVHQEKAK